jgi:rubrerythrin
VKFFIPVIFCTGSGGETYSSVNQVYGPYESHDAIDDAIASLWPNNKRMQVLVFDGEIVNVRLSTKEGPEHEKRVAGDMRNYIKKGELYVCKDCNGAILGAVVAHPVHQHEIPGAGFGECQYETIAYCPNCEIRPNPNGSPVYIR